MSERDDNIFRAEMAERAKRYKEMSDEMKKIAALNSELTPKERSMLSVAYKYMIVPRRAQWRAIDSIEKGNKSTDAYKFSSIAKSLREKIENEIREICLDVTDVIEKQLLPFSTISENIVFYYKLKGDYQRYLAEIATGSDREAAIDSSMAAYETGTDIAKKDLRSTHPFRLSLALNYSMLYYEILKSRRLASRIAEAAYCDANDDLDSLTKDNFSDTTEVMQLIKDNLLIWMEKEDKEDKTWMEKEDEDKEDKTWMEKEDEEQDQLWMEKEEEEEEDLRWMEKGEEEDLRWMEKGEEEDQL